MPVPGVGTSRLGCTGLSAPVAAGPTPPAFDDAGPIAGPWTPGVAASLAHPPPFARLAIARALATVSTVRGLGVRPASTLR